MSTINKDLADSENSIKEKVDGPWIIIFKRLKKNKLAMAGLVTLVVIILVSVFGPMISPYDINKTNLVNLDQPPSFAHPLGTDGVGRDRLTRLMFAGRISLLIGFVSEILTVLIGTVIGVISGYYGKKVDAFLMRVVDIIMCFPYLIILILLSAILSDLKIPSQYRIFVLMFIIGILNWTGLSRMVRGQILSLREQEFMQATEALGLKDSRKMFRHLLPNTFSIIIVSATLGIGGAILSEAALSFLGLGVTPPTPSWGQMIQDVQDLYSLKYRPWAWIPPGLCILITVLSINLIGDGLRDAIDPKLKNR